MRSAPTAAFRAVAVTIAYRHSPMEIRTIREVSDSGEAAEEIVKSLKNFDASVVLLVDRYAPMDFTQLVRDHAEEHPETVMETPQVTGGGLWRRKFPRGGADLYLSDEPGCSAAGCSLG